MLLQIVRLYVRFFSFSFPIHVSDACKLQIGLRFAELRRFVDNVSTASQPASIDRPEMHYHINFDALLPVLYLSFLRRFFRSKHELAQRTI